MALASAPPASSTEPDERLASFARALDAIKRDVESSLGKQDVDYIVRLRRFSRACEVLGRGLLHFSWEPISFAAAVLVLFVHKQIEALEIGHSVLHGTYDDFPGAERFRARGFRWLMPIDEASWMYQHNVRHHQYTNVAERDPDLRYGPVRLSRRMPYKFYHALQPLLTITNWLGFGTMMNVHATGLVDVYIDPSGPPLVLKDRRAATVLRANYALLRKWVKYYAKEALLFPLLAGAGFWKVFLGNMLSDVLRNIYTALSIHCGHVNASDYPAGTRAGSRAGWYAMQVEATHNFEVPAFVSILCGGSGRQIEHHLFPRLPNNRLHEIAPRVRAVCDAHGVRYRTASWPRTLGNVVRTLWWLSFKTPRPGELRRQTVGAIGADGRWQSSVSEGEGVARAGA